MVKLRPPKRNIDSVAIKGSSKPIKPGDCVLMRAPDRKKLPYVARVEGIEEPPPPPPARGRKGGGGVRVRVRWYYRPEEAIGGRRQFHGSKEVFLSDHYDVQSVDTIERRCFVHSFKEYTKLNPVGNDDFFCRFEYQSKSGNFIPDRIAVFCKCEMPYNPDDLMIQCEGCSDWYHPPCINMSSEKAKKLEHFFCQTCTTQNGKEAPETSQSGDSGHSKPKVGTKRRRR